ncbi:phosphatidylcholine synthase [Pseudomonas typographi]|uniref:Phosphatidylcholine synthase n=1 Tax=Pseudomonas typographi TaxID=2715964 RepID=A0ABR7Z036_9PSED|nr:phosphatidylcholine/phosphatidylserine synthase [Pseudomonas typographi]MBD1551388.1 phosphatidylcholine/phosphatidylserine synthase [Pseudomonas typographi]MBD1586441.1 phosphatidylcholine/phosphatidylserine synthase [Pseudomonas typographi]MBD1598846.1 phosphatidylcholine/phosphatidylserine synthase [Pseudomonas typographi]
MNRHSLTLAAWSAHAFTATGVFTALLATLALFEDKPQACLLWLGVALIVDGVDGTLARRINVREVLPHFDGSVLDLVIDYLTYVFIPALFIYKYIPLPEHTLLLTTTVILVSSLFCFCNVNMKSSDNYFVGFPAAWNVVALCLYILTPAPWLTFVTVIGLAILTVSPMKFLHPFRVKRFMPFNIGVTFGWLLCSLWLIVIRPALEPAPLLLWLACSAYFAGICVWRTALEWRHRAVSSRRM